MSSHRALRSRSPIGRRQRPEPWVSFTARCPDGRVCGKKGATLGTFETVFLGVDARNYVTNCFTNVLQIIVLQIMQQT
jgi:hypothetical protein